MSKVKTVIAESIPKRLHQRLFEYYVALIKAKNTVFPFLYSGDRYECPFCGHRFRKFLPAGFDAPSLFVGGGYMHNITCPRCYSFEKERLVYLYLKEKTNFFESSFRVLHFAPERNLQKVIKQHKNIDYTSVDIHSPLAMVKMDITDIKYPDKIFDVVMCNHVLEHIPDDKKAMQELFRILKVGGWAILQAPISPTLEQTFEDPAINTPETRQQKYGQYDHLRLYGKDYKNRLESVGFAVEVKRCSDLFDSATIDRYRLNPQEDVFVASRD